MSMYDDQSLLFITSTDARVPQGRNARSKHRTKAAARAAPAKGAFATIDFRSTAHGGDAQAPKRRKRDNVSTRNGSGLVRRGQPILQEHSTESSINCLTRPITTDWALPFINPAEILAVATFHVRRMTVIAMQSDSERLLNVLRCRQWSCIPYAYNCFGQDTCVDSAILCVADRIRFLTGCPFSATSMLKHYTKALRQIQSAIDEPSEHNPENVVAAVQLLAIYEMLDSLDNVAWSKHIAGAQTMIQTYTAITPVNLEKWNIKGCGHALPMFGDALMKGDTNFFRTYPWRELLWAIFIKIKDPPEGVQDLLQCLRLVPSLLLDVDSALNQRCGGINDELKFALLDRAHDTQYRIRSALRGNQLYTQCYYKEMFSSFDLLGTFLSALVALDRLIESLRPAHVPCLESKNDPTEELCAQLFQLELGASGQYPAADVLAGFQHVGKIDEVGTYYANA